MKPASLNSFIWASPREKSICGTPSLKPWYDTTGSPLAVVKPYSRSFFSDFTAMSRFHSAASSSYQGRSMVWLNGPAGMSTASSVPLRTVNRSGRASVPPRSAVSRTSPRYSPAGASAGTLTVSQKVRVTPSGTAAVVCGMM